MEPNPVSNTPILDAIETKLRHLSPSLEHVAWERTPGNELGREDGSSWILQVPDLWGWESESALEGLHPGIKQLLAKIENYIAEARQSVDITTWGVPNFIIAPAGPYPDGQFLEAMSRGLKTAVGRLRQSQSHGRLQVRLLSGVLFHLGDSPEDFLAGLKEMIGQNASYIDFNIAVMVTDQPRSQNHTKLIVVDGQSVICGGINWMSNYYIQDGPSWVYGGLGGIAPVTDLDIALRGPAALSAGKFLDRLWAWTCQNVGDKAKIASSMDKGKLMPSLYEGHKTSPVGKLDVISVGSLGYGIQKKDEKSGYELKDVANVDQGAYHYGLLFKSSSNDTNTDRDFMTVNPDAYALQVLIESAERNIVLSQQDINGYSGEPVNQPLFDVRLIDALISRMMAGVKVQIVLSNPGRPDYSNIVKIEEAKKSLRDRAILMNKGNEKTARDLLFTKLQLATLRVSSKPTWPGDRRYRLHTKLICVDDRAFYVGSRNAYPDTTQDHGFIIEDEGAARELWLAFLRPQWQYSQSTACQW
jgi:hypothetical protein